MYFFRRPKQLTMRALNIAMLANVDKIWMKLHGDDYMNQELVTINPIIITRVQLWLQWHFYHQQNKKTKLTPIKTETNFTIKI